MESQISQLTEFGICFTIVWVLLTVIFIFATP